MKKRVLLRVAYDGTNYHGWQVQPGAVTIEQVLNEKLTELLGEPIEVIGASRTDSGVMRWEMWQYLTQNTVCLRTRSVSL